jgi:hypothetical protein
VIDRAGSKAAIARVAAIAEPLLVELVNFGSATLARWAALPTLKEPDLALIFTYRHLIDLTDAIQILISDAASSPARLQLRAAFEAFLTIRWVTKGDTERRAYAFLVRDALAQISYLERLRELKERPGPSAWIDASISKLEQRLERPGWREVHADFVAIKAASASKRNKKRWWPPWYSVYGGPADLAGLAVRCDSSYDYDLLYRSWSDVSHSTDITWQMNPDSSLRRLRSPLHLKLTAMLPAEFVSKATKSVARHLGVPSAREQADWYVEEVQGRLATLEELPDPT